MKSGILYSALDGFPSRFFSVLVLGLLVGTLFPLASLEAQGRRERGGPRARSLAGSMTEGRPSLDAIERQFFSPQRVMRLQSEIALSAEQREVLIAELQSAQSDLVPLQFEAQEAQAALAKMVRENRLDEQRVLEQAQRVMELEARVRTRHLTLLIRIKNLLTPEQQRKLEEMRRRRLARPRGR